MHIAITGSRGQLGQELCRALEAEHELFPLDLPEHDITDLSVVSTIAQAEPDLVIHTAAMTDVDGCTLNPDAAYATNALGTRNVALACQRAEASLLYISTNEVFDGTKKDAYMEFDQPNPINVYGHSKLVGEEFVRSLLYRYYIVRTSWLFGHRGNNFVNKMIALAQDRGELRLVTDEVASPSYAPDLAQAIAALIGTEAYGTYHFTNSGVCSRFDYARRVLELAGLGQVPLHPITLDQFPRPSRPPRQSALRNFCGAALGITLRPWEEAVEEFLSR